MKPKEELVCRTLEDRNYGGRIVSGMSALWNEKALFDYIIKTSDGKEFQAHRVFLASVSDYFRAMLCGNMLESSKDYVELKGVNSVGFGPLLHFVYTGQLTLNEENVPDVLTAASHLQIDAAMMLCARFLEESLSLNNCVDISHIAEMYSLDRLKEKTNDFVIANFSDLVKNGHHCRFSGEQLSHYLKSDELKCGTEFGLFNCIRQWLDFDKEARIKQAAGMMQFVRFPLMLPSDITEISKSSPELTSPGSPCKKFLDQAVKYHRMQQNARLALKSSQTQIRNKPSVVAFSGDVDDFSTSKRFFVLGEDKQWRRLPDVEQGFSHASVTVLENYMYVCGGILADDHSRRSTDKCYVFDPRFMTWSSIANMTKARSHFCLVTCKGAVYALGGCTEFNNATVSPVGNTDTIEKYSVEKNEWNLIGELPDALRKHACCVMKGKIFVSGGLKEDWMASHKFFSIDTDDMSLTELPDMPHVRFSHHMFSCWKDSEGQEVIFVVDSKGGGAMYFSPTASQVNCAMCVFEISFMMQK